MSNYKFSLPYLHFYQLPQAFFSKEISHLQVKSKVKFIHGVQIIRKLLAHSIDHRLTSSYLHY